MASEIKVNTVKRATGTTITIGESGDSVAVTGNIVKSNALQASDGGNIIDQCGTTVTLGATGDTIALACGASASGFGLSWCSSVKTAAFCAAAGNGYFINTCGGAFEVTLPGSASVGDQINFTDYARTWGTACKELTLNQNSLKFQGNTTPKPEYDTAGATVKIVYSGATQGWIPQLDKGTELETPQTYSLQYLVVAGGGAGGGARTSYYGAGGGGAGGMRLVATKSFTVCKGSSIPITVGAGAPTTAGFPNTTQGASGTTSVFSTITSAGGGGGGNGLACAAPVRTPTTNKGADGGSGGGGGSHGDPSPTAGAGNTPPSPCTQGKPGGQSSPNQGGGGGGGHAAAAADTSSPVAIGTNGGAGTVEGIRGTPFDPVAYAGGGGGGMYLQPAYPSPTNGAGGLGGGGAAGSGAGGNGVAGGANTGGGGGAASSGGTNPSCRCGGAGGSGIVILRRVTACSTSTSGTVTTCGSDTIHSFTGDGTFVA